MAYIGSQPKGKMEIPDSYCLGKKESSFIRLFTVDGGDPVKVGSLTNRTHDSSTDFIAPKSVGQLPPSIHRNQDPEGRQASMGAGLQRSNGTGSHCR